MRRICTLFIIWFCLGAVVGTAQAEQVSAKKATSIYSRPGERSRVVTRVRAGTKLKVISREGRWIKVRVRGRTGYITRTNVEVSASVEKRNKVQRKQSRKDRKRSFVEGRKRKKRKNQPAPRDRVGADAVEEGFIDEEPEKPREKQRRQRERRAERRQERKDIGGDTDDTDADHDDSVAGDFDDDPPLEDDGEASVDQVGPAASTGAKLTTKALVGLGFQNFGQSFRSNGMGPLAGYDLSSGSALISLGAEIGYSIRRKYIAGGDLTYRYVKSSPGISVAIDDMSSEIGYSMQQFDLGGRFGYRLYESLGLIGYARLGYHYGLFSVDDFANYERNLIRLPSETLSGVTIGVLSEALHITDKISGRLGFDYLVLASRSQTAGLEDGQNSSASAFWINAKVEYLWRYQLRFSLAYQLLSATTDWTGMAESSERGHNATGATRTDTFNTITIGVGRNF